MLKYYSKRFWGLICKNKKNEVGISAKQFADYNQKLFYDEKRPVDVFQLPDDMEQANISLKEVKNVLTSHF